MRGVGRTWRRVSSVVFQLRLLQANNQSSELPLAGDGRADERKAREDHEPDVNFCRHDGDSIIYSGTDPSKTMENQRDGNPETKRGRERTLVGNKELGENRCPRPSLYPPDLKFQTQLPQRVTKTA